MAKAPRIVNRGPRWVQDVQRRGHSALYAILSQGAAYAHMLTPVDTGFLVNSQYAPKISVNGARLSGHVGYMANYAAFVHSAPGKLKGKKRPKNRGLYWAPGGEPGFLTKGLSLIHI